MTRLRRLPPTICAFHLGFSLVSNLGQLDEDLAVIGTNIQAAQAFVAGPDPAGLRSRFQGIRVVASSHVLNQSQGGMYIEVAMIISWVALVNRSHPYLENDQAP